MRDFHLDSDHDATRLKPPTIVSGSAPRTAGSTAEGPAAETPDPRVSATVWAVVGTVVLAVAGGVLMFSLGRGDAGETPGVDPASSRPPSTPASIDPGLVAEPVLRGSRDGGAVLISWAASDGGQPGDTWQWRRTDTGEGERTEEESVSLRSRGRVCVQVRLIRDGSQSAWFDRCVD